MVSEEPENQGCSQETQEGDGSNACILLEDPCPDVGVLSPGKPGATGRPRWHLVADGVRKEREAEIGRPCG